MSDNECLIPGCNEPDFDNYGYCQKHVQQYLELERVHIERTDAIEVNYRKSYKEAWQLLRRAKSDWIKDEMKHLQRKEIEMTDSIIESGDWVFYDDDYFEVLDIDGDTVTIMELQLVKNKKRLTVPLDDVRKMTATDEFEAVTDLEGYD